LLPGFAVEGIFKMMARLFLLALLLTGFTVRAETTTTIATGLDYSTGNYGTSTSTTIVYIPVILKAQFDYSYLKLTVPYISVSSAGGVVSGIGPIKKTVSTKVTTNSGLGDVVATAGYTVYETQQLALDIAGNIKFGTADAAQNLGTGKNDYSAQLDGFYTIDMLTWFATGGYKIVGEPEGTNLNNIFYVTLGGSRKLSEATSAGAMLNAAQSSSDAAAAPLDLTFFASSKFNKTNRVQFGFLMGLSDASPDLGLNVMVSGSL
jgi:hypothetical protein